MKNYEDQLKKFLKENNISAQHQSFEKSCRSVEDAAKAAHANADDFVKNICLIDDRGNLVVAIIKGEDRVSTAKVGKILNIKKPRFATAEEILEKTGYPCGGTPSFGYRATFLVDSRVLEKETVFTGGGSENSLLKISSIDLVKANNGRVVNIRK